MVLNLNTAPRLPKARSACRVGDEDERYPKPGKESLCKLQVSKTPGKVATRLNTAHLFHNHLKKTEQDWRLSTSCVHDPLLQKLAEHFMFDGVVEVKTNAAPERANCALFHFLLHKHQSIILHNASCRPKTTPVPPCHAYAQTPPVVPNQTTPNRQ